MQELSTEVYTHKLKLKGMEVKYITSKMAQQIFSQLMEGDKILIADPDTLTFITRYKSEVELTLIEGEEKTLEYIMVQNNLDKDQKEKVRAIITQRKKDGDPNTEGNIRNIINKILGKSEE